MEKVVALLKEIFVDKVLVSILLEKSVYVEIEEGKKILDEGNYIKTIPIVIEGRVKVLRCDESGKELLLYHIIPGESCALSIAAGLNHEKSVAYAVTEVKTNLLLIPVNDLQEMLREYPRINNFVLKLFHQRFNELISFIDSIAFKNMDFRLVNHLKKMSAATGNRIIETTHQQLADELGTAREVVSRLLKQLEKENKVKNHRGTIELTDLL